MADRTIVVVTAGLTEPSSTRLLADRLAAATERHLVTDGVTPSLEVIELRDRAQDLVNHLLTGFPSPALRATLDRVLAADGVIAVSPIFNASYSGLFKLFFDVLERGSLSGVPALIGATGGTVRHSLALDHAFRPLFVYLGASVGTTAVFAASEDWGTGGTGDAFGGALADRIDRAAAELATAVAARGPRTVTDPFADPVPFEELLRGG
jgi:FMN reductase